MKKLVISSGAGISAESGITTFRDAGGLWENYPVMKVASADGFRENPALIHEFYNKRRDQLQSAQPNAAHLILKELEKDFDVQVSLRMWTTFMKKQVPQKFCTFTAN